MHKEIVYKYLAPRKWLGVQDEITTYWRRLPIYTIAICPFCGSRYTANVDTHSLLLRGGTGLADYTSVFSSSYQNYGCEHFIAVQSFLNLHNHFPVEKEYLSNLSGDIPIVTPELFQSDETANAVIHSLPFCRIEVNDKVLCLSDMLSETSERKSLNMEQARFVPRYTLFTITYYSATPSMTYKAAMSMLYPKQLSGKSDDEYNLGYLFSSSSRIQRETIVGDLAYWVTQGKLHWLDSTNSEFALTASPISSFPYHYTQGFGEPFVYRKRPKPRWWWQQKNWHPDGEIWDEGETKILTRPD